MKKIYLLLALVFVVASTFAQTQRYEGGVRYKKRNATGSVDITPGANTDIKFNDSTILRYNNGTLSIIINGTQRFKQSATTTIVPALTIGSTAITTTPAQLNYVAGVTSAIQTQLNAKVDTGRTVTKVIDIGAAKVGGTAGWVVNAGENLSLATLPASQTSSTLVIPITNSLKVGSRITGFSLIGQIESAGNTVTITAELRKLSAAVGDVADASVGAMSAPLSTTADVVMSSLNASKAGLSETVGPNETFYILITATTAGSTDVALQGVVLNLSE